ncbi:MAG: hypothetical protein ACYC7A_14200 [Thermoanaerobaculia bacterium]
MIAAPQTYALGAGDARKSLRRISRWARFLGVMGFIALALAGSGILGVLLFVDGVPKLPFVIVLAMMIASAFPSYFMITTARTFRAIPERAVLTHFDRPFTELHRLFFWFVGVSAFDLALSVVLVLAGVIDPSTGLLAGTGSAPEIQVENVAKLRAVAGAIDAFAKENGTYPKALSQLEAATVPAVDAWARPFVYEPESHGAIVDGYTLASLGANGTADEAVPRLQGVPPPKPKDLDSSIVNGIFTAAPDPALIGTRAAE